MPRERSDDPGRRRDRGQIQLPDVIAAFFVLVAIIATYPFWNHFIGMVSSEADPFSTLILQLAVPFIVLSLAISVGVSARRGGL